MRHRGDVLVIAQFVLLALLLLAVAKKKWKRNPNDLAKASRRLGDYQDGRARSCEVRLDD